MIKFPNQQELNELKAFHEPFCLTIYTLPIEANAATRPNRIEMKNLLREAEKALAATGVERPIIDRTLKPVRLLIETPDFGSAHGESLVLFIHSRLFRYYHIPGQSSPHALTVDTGFNLEPLLRTMQDNQPYYVLALGHKNVRLLKGDHYQLKAVHLKQFPTNMKETLGIDEYPKSRETHTIAPARTGKGSEAYHEQYNVSQTDKDMLLEFFRHIDNRLHRLFLRHQRPLVIAGVNYLLPIYRRVNTYPGLLTDAIKGNLQHVDLRTINEKAWPIVKKSMS